jgi:hypothetical protein
MCYDNPNLMLGSRSSNECKTSAEVHYIANYHRINPSRRYDPRRGLELVQRRTFHGLREAIALSLVIDALIIWSVIHYVL